MQYSAKNISEIIGGEMYGSSESTINHISIDSRSIQNSINTVFFALVTSKGNGHLFIQDLIDKGVKAFVVSEDIKLSNEDISLIKVDNTTQALQEFAKSHRQKFDIPVIGITGSYGKTIVKEWLYQLLSPEYSICRSPKSYNSQIGVPLSVLQLNESHSLAIFEAGISQIGEMDTLESIIQPTIGVLTKIGEAHQEGFSSREQKIEEKKVLFRNCNTLIENKELEHNFSFPFTDIASIENCKQCILVMQYFGYENSEIQKRVNKLSSLALRLEMKKGIDNSTIINDSYNVSYSSLVLSLEYLNTQAKEFPKTLILSSIPQHSFDNKEFLDLLESQNLKQLIVVGNEKFPDISIDQIHQFESTDTLMKELDNMNFSNHFVLIKGRRECQFEKISNLLEEKNHRTVLEINLSQLSANFDSYRNKLKPTTKIMAMVKAFAYGTGTTEIPAFLENKGVNYLGVAYADEGITLRKSGIKIPIVVMNPEPGTFTQLIDNELEPEIYSMEELDEFIRSLILLGRKEYPIHIKLETGMNRLGFLPNEIPKLIEEIKSQPEVYVKSIFSHLSSADDLDEKEFTLGQINKFQEYSKLIIDSFPYHIDRHILNTAGIENYSEFQFDMVRLGIGLYGINVGKNQKIKPVGALKTVIIQLKNIKIGDSVGYGRSMKAERDMQIAILPIGYSDGLRRSLGNGKFSVYVNGKQCYIVGNVCMDLCMIDVTEVEATVGEEVEIFGANNSVDSIAKAMDTIPYEVLTSVSQRVKRVFFKE